MSLILTWSPPFETLYSPAAYACRVYRNDILINEDVPWDIYEETNNLATVDDIYKVDYVEKNNTGVVACIQNKDIERHVRPANTCKFTHVYTMPDGTPGRCLCTQVTYPYVNNFVGRYFSNTVGETYWFGVYGKACNILLNGCDKELQTIVPAVQEVNVEELEGSWVPFEKRGRI